MTVRIECPESHSFDIHDSRRNDLVACPRCFLVFIPAVDSDSVHHAKPPKPPQKGKPRRSRDDDDDDEEEDDEPINWTPKKRQVAKLQTALKVLNVAFYTHMVFLGLDALNMLFGVLIGFERFLADAGPGFSAPIALLYGYGLTVVGGPCLLIIYGAQIFAWFMELLGPGKSGSRGSAIVSMLLFFTPVLLFIFYFILTFALKDMREQVAINLFRLILGFAIFCGLIAYYTSIASIGGIAAYLNLTTEKNKPSALGWFIIGSFMIRGITAGAAIWIMELSPGMIGCIVLFGTIGLSCQVYWMSLGSIRELLGVVKAVDAAINKSLRED